jgi:hypothetical protein
MKGAVGAYKWGPPGAAAAAVVTARALRGEHREGWALGRLGHAPQGRPRSGEVGRARGARLGRAMTPSWAVSRPAGPGEREARGGRGRRGTRKMGRQRGKHRPKREGEIEGKRKGFSPF